MRKKIFANKFIVACLVVSGLFGASLPVDAYFSDEEKSENYSFSLGTLDAGASFLEGGGFSSVDPSEENELSRKIEIKNQGSLDFQYRIEVRNESGEYCSELELEADNLSNSGVECESSGLEGFECKAQNALAAEKSETWELRLAKSGKDLNEAQECQFDLAVVAWQENMPNEEKGFWDEEILSEEVTFAETESGVADHLVINEFYIEGTNDWLELYNPGDEDINLEDGNYRIERSTASGGDPDYYMEFGDTGHGTYPGGVVVPSRGYYLITREDANEDLKGKADAIIDSDRGFALTEDNAVYLGVGPISGSDDDDIIDFVGYGQSDDYEGGGSAPSLTESDTKSIQRKQAGQDTNDNAEDFVLKEEPTPENSGNGSLSEVVLNEFLPNSSEETYEYVELYNNGDSEVDAEGYYIELRDNNGDVTVVNIDSPTTKEYENESTVVPAGGFLAVTADDYEDLDEHNDILDNAEGSLELYDNHGRLLDAVEYPLKGEDPGEVREDKTIARIPDGTGDWVDPVATPGESNVLESGESEESKESGKSEESEESGTSKESRKSRESGEDEESGESEESEGSEGSGEGGESEEDEDSGKDKSNENAAEEEKEDGKEEDNEKERDEKTEDEESDGEMKNEEKDEKDKEEEDKEVKREDEDEDDNKEEAE